VRGLNTTNCTTSAHRAKRSRNRGTVRFPTTIPMRGGKGAGGRAAPRQWRRGRGVAESGTRENSHGITYDQTNLCSSIAIMIKSRSSD